MILGFTGTREGMTPQQHWAVSLLLEELGPAEVHHGDCIGADAEFHALCVDLEIPVVIHPPASDTHRAWSQGPASTGVKAILSPKPHLTRNRDIVNACSILIGAPRLMQLEQRGGTSYTVRWAEKLGKQVIVAWPDGTVKR